MNNPQPAAAHSPPSFYRKHRQLILYSIGLFIVLALSFGALSISFSKKLRAAQDDFDQRISLLSEETTDTLKETKSILEGQIAQVNGSLSSELDDFRVQNEREISTLNGLIDAIEEQTNIQLGELQSELKNVQIKSADFSAIVDDVLQSVVSITTNAGQGSGAIITKDGYVVTNFHVISGATASSIRLHTYDGNSHETEVAGYDSDADIALLKINGNFDSLPFGDADEAKIGERVIALGNPAGLDFTVTEGIISAFRTSSDGYRYLQVDVPINPGNSGGPLVDVRGEILGINNFKLKGDFEGLGFAIIANTVEDITDDLISMHRAQQSAP